MPKTLRPHHEGKTYIPSAVFQMMCTATILIQVYGRRGLNSRHLTRMLAATSHVPGLGKILIPVRKLIKRSLGEMMASGSQLQKSQTQLRTNSKTRKMQTKM